MKMAHPFHLFMCPIKINIKLIRGTIAFNIHPRPAIAIMRVPLDLSSGAPISVLTAPERLWSVQVGRFPYPLLKC